MSLRVEERAVGEHMGLWRDLLAQTRDTPPDERMLVWRYLENPHGVARAWALIDESTGTVGGFTVVMPRRMRLGTRDLMAWIGADFSILPKYRTLGPALQLRRAARDGIDRGDADLLYAFPNERMTAIHDRVGHTRVGMQRRYARPAASQLHIRNATKSGAVATILAPAVDIAHRLAMRAQAVGSRHAISELSPVVFDARFDALSARALPHDRVAGVRDAAYLQWRYPRQPGWRGGALIAERDGALTGYLVFGERAELLHVTDLLAVDNVSALALLRRAVGIAVAAGWSSVSVAWLEHAYLQSVLDQFGFSERQDVDAVYAYIPERHAGLLDARTPARWHLTVGDRDV